MKNNKRNYLMKNFSYRTLVAVLIFGLLAGIAPFSTKAAPEDEENTEILEALEVVEIPPIIDPVLVTIDSPEEGETYYTDEPLTISWSDAFSGSVGLSLRTEAQESLPPASGGTVSVGLPANITSHTITAFGMTLIPANRYKAILVCGEIICGETGYFDIKIRVGERATNGDDDTTGNPPSTGGTNTGNVGNGDDDLPGTPPSTGGTNTGGTTNGDDDNSVPPENNTGNVGNGDDDLPGDTHGNDNGNTTNGDDDVAGTPQQSEETPTVVQQSFRTSSGGSSPSPKKLISNSLPSLADIGSCSYINDYLSIKSNNNPTEVTKLQIFLVNTEEMNISVNGIFDQNTFDAVKAFQTKYLDEVMLPWGLQTATGVVSYTTKKKINEIYCKTTFSLTPEQLAAIERYRTSLGSSEEFVAPSNVEVGFAEPEVIETPALAEQTEEAPVIPEPQQTQTASALDASEGFFQKIINFFKDIF